MTTLLDGGYRFETFVIGSSNRLAASAAHAVAEAPGTAYNPLFVYGGSGLGKTHLVAAIAFQARQTQHDLRVEFSTGEEVAERLHKAIAAGQQAEFARRYQEVDLLLLDDVQFLTGQRETQTELLRLFNLMQGKGRQLVMTSDRPPAEIPDVDQRLLSRLSGGLIVDVGAPDYEMRLAILRNACADRTLEFGDGVLEETARLPYANVRELKGALNRLSAFQQLEGQELTADDVRAVLGERPSSVVAAVTSSSREDATEYEGFLADVLLEVETRVEPWRVHLGEACAFWRTEGYASNVLERAMALPVAPDVNGLLATFAAAVEHLRNLEAQALAVDPSLRGHPAFRNPETIAEAQGLLDRAISSAMPLPLPNPALTRAALEAGTANQLALKAFDSVLEHPGQRYNPLFMHGGSGVGKTHLAHALGNAVRAAWPRKAVACLAASTFVEELVAAMQEGGVERWRSRYRAADVLILDDVHHLADKERTQEELFHLFNHLYDRGSQIVLTSDRAPRAIVGLADRLRSRFEGGLVAAIQAPDRTLRERLTTRWLLEAGQAPEQGLVALLADREVGSVRELGGLITRLVAVADVAGRPLTLEMAQRELGVARTDVSVFSARTHMPGLVDDFFLDREKVIWEWPDLGGRLIEGVPLMAIRGNLSEASLADVLQLLALGQKSGCLSIARDGSFGTVHFDRGRIAHAAIINRRDRLGDRLVRSGTLAADVLARSVSSTSPHDDRELAMALLAKGLVERDVLMVHYRAQVEEAVYHLFSWDTGTFTFEPESTPADGEPLLSISADSLLLEGARRVDEWTQIEKKVSSLDLIFEADTKRLAQADVTLSPTQQRIVPLLDGGHDVHAVVERSGFDEFEVGKALFGLITAGFAQRVGRSAARRQPPPESRIAEHRNLGVAFYRTGLYDEAQREFRRVLELRDSDGAARFHLGLVHLRRSEWEEAVETLRRTATEPDAPAAVPHNLAFALEKLGRLDEAREALADAASRSAVPDPRIALSEAMIALQRGELSVADDRLSAARAAWGARQPSAAWYHAAGLAAALAGDAARAIAVLDEGLTVHPHVAALHNNLAAVHERRGSYELAARTLDHALLEDANCPHLHKNLGDYLYRAQRYDEAFDAFTRVVRLAIDHGADVYLKLGNIHYRRGAMDQARVAWERALEIEPTNRIVRANLDALRRADPGPSAEQSSDTSVAAGV